MLSNSHALALLRLAERLDCKLSTSNEDLVSDGYNQIVLNDLAGLVADFFDTGSGVECAVGFRWDDEDSVNVFAPSVPLALDKALVEMRDMGGVFERLVTHLDWDAVLS